MSQPSSAVPHDAPAASAVPTHAERGALAALALSMLLASLATSIANVGLPTLAHAFDASFQAVQWVVVAYLLAITTAIVSAGRLGDVVGRRRLLLAGLALFTGASALCGAAPTLGWLIAARAAQGLGAAIMTAMAMAFVATTVPKARTGRAMGLLGALSALGTALGPALGGVLIAAFGWRSLFFASVPLGLATLLLARRFLAADGPRANAGSAGLDGAGTVLLALTLAAYALALTLGRGHFGALNAALLAVAVVGVALFVRVEASARSPLLRLALLRAPVQRASLAASALVATVMMATMVVGPFHLAHAVGLDAAGVGLALSAGPLVVASAAVPAGRATDRWGAHRMTALGLGAMAAGSVLLVLLPVSFGVIGYVAPIVVVTAGYALFQTANNTGVMADVRPDERGVVAGMLNLARNLGLVTGASAMGAVFAYAATAADATMTHPAAVAAGTRATFAVAAALIAAALALVTRAQRKASYLRPDPPPA